MKLILLPLLAMGLITAASAETAPNTSAPPPPDGPTRAIGVHNCLSHYPAEARAAGIEGLTTLHYRITKEGLVTDITVWRSSGNRSLDTAAVACVQEWRYSPRILDGELVASDWTNTVKWVLNVNSYDPAATPPRPATPPPSPPTTAATPPPPPSSVGRPHVCMQDYPPISVLEREQGKVTLAFTITDKGRTEDIRIAVSSGYEALDNASMACVRTWRYKPATHDGQPISVPWRAEVMWRVIN
jgi:TonB family protein